MSESNKIIHQYLDIVNKRIPDIVDNPFKATSDSVKELQHAFDIILRHVTLTRDDIKAQLLIHLYNTIKSKSQVPEYSWPANGMKTKAKDLNSFANDLKKTIYEEIGTHILERLEND